MLAFFLIKYKQNLCKMGSQSVLIMVQLIYNIKAIKGVV